ncbi:hypothetical protein SAMN05444166_2057 [Singulisphaera sp. GP187]|nr:hypothetical protein SAMN05444166_2057 [Singulisphaera sp. GP187]
MKYDQLFYATRMSLGLAWKLTVLAFALAIVLGMMAGPAAQSERQALEQSFPVRVEKEENHYKIMTQVPAGNDSLHLEVIDPLGKKHFSLVYDKNGIAHSFTQNTKLIHVGFYNTNDGNESVSIRTPKTFYAIRAQASGSSNVVAETRSAVRRTLGEIWVSPEGERLPSGDDANVPK